jgi:hypothetical protein
MKKEIMEKNRREVMALRREKKDNENTPDPAKKKGKE